MKRFGRKLAAMVLALAMVMSLILVTPVFACNDPTQPFAGLVTITDPVLGTVQIYAEVQGNDEEPLFYINGYSTDSPDEREADAALISALKATGEYNVIWFDRPGLGQSPASSNPRTSEIKAEEEILLLRELGFRKVNIICHSGGGFELTEILNKCPNLVKKVVAIDTTHPDAFFDLKNTLSTYWQNVTFAGQTWSSIWDIFKTIAFGPMKDGSYQDMELSAYHVKTVLQNKPNLYKKVKMKVLSASTPGIEGFVSQISNQNLDQAIALDWRQVNVWQPDYVNWGRKITQEVVPNTSHYVWYHFADPSIPGDQNGFNQVGLNRILEVADDLIN